MPPDAGIRSGIAFPTAALIFGLSQIQALVILFVLLPVVLAALIVPLMVWRNSGGTPPVLTSEVLAGGLPGEAEILSVRTLGSIVELRPMVRFVLRIRPDDGGESFDLEVVQALPRVIIGRFSRGDTVEVRYTADRAYGAVVWADSPSPG